MLSDGIDVVVALCILAVSCVLRRRENDINPAPELSDQAVCHPLAVMGTIRQKPAHIDINIGKQVWQRRFIAHMLRGHLRGNDIASFRVESDVEFTPSARQLSACTRREEGFAGFPGAVFLFMAAVAAMHFQTRAVHDGGDWLT